MTIVGLAGESQTRTQSPSLVRKSLIISMKIMMIILLLMLMMAFIMRGGHDNESEIGNNTPLPAFIMKKERGLATKITRTTAGAFSLARCSFTSATRTNRTRSDSWICGTRVSRRLSHPSHVFFYHHGHHLNQKQHHHHRHCPNNNHGGDSPPAGGAYFRLRLWLSGVLGHWGENQNMEIDFQQ